MRIATDLPHTALFKPLQALASFPVERVILFGSRARGDNAARADIDLAFDAPDIKHHDWVQVQELFEQADMLLSVDAMLLHQVSDQLRANIIKEGCILYER